MRKRVRFVFITLSLVAVILAASVVPTIIMVKAASAITYIGDVGANSIKDTGNPDLVVTTTSGVAAGDDIIIAYATDPTQDLNLDITDTAGNTYQQSAMGINVGNLRTYIFAAYDVDALTIGDTITITQTVVSSTIPAARAAVVSVFRGLAPAGALEQSCVASGSGTTPSSGAATTTQNDELLIGVVGTEGPETDTAGTWQNSFTEGPRAGTTATTGNAEITVSMGWQIVTSAGDYSAEKSGIASRDWAAAIAAYKTTDTGISYIGDVGGAQSDVAGTSLAVTTTAAVAAGDDILVTFAADPAATVSSVTDTAGNTYNQVIDVVNSGNVRTFIFAAYDVDALSGGSTITISHASVTARSAVVSAFRGLADSNVVDQTQTATGSTSAVSSGATGTTTQADELLIGVVGLEGPNYDAPSVWQNSFTYGPRLGTHFGSGSGGGDTDITVQMGWRIVAATDSYTAQIVNLNTARDWAAGIATFKAEEIVPVEQNAYLTVRGGNNAIYHRTFDKEADSWGSWFALPSGATPKRPATAVASGKLYFVVNGGDDESLWFSSVTLEDSSFSGWTMLTGASQSPPTLASNGTHLALVVQGMNNMVYYRTYDVDGASWSAWAGLPGATSGQPAAAMLGDKLHVVVLSESQMLWHGSVNLDDDSFTGWTMIAGSTDAAPSLTASSTLNAVYLGVKGLNGAIYLNEWSGSWQGWTPLATGSTGESPTIAVTNDVLQVVVKGLDGASLWHCNVNLNTDVQSSWQALSGFSPSAPTMAS
jgi:hypothetical protein